MSEIELRIRAQALADQSAMVTRSHRARLAAGDHDGLGTRIMDQRMSELEAMLVAGIVLSALGDYFIERDRQSFE